MGKNRDGGKSSNRKSEGRVQRGAFTAMKFKPKNERQSLAMEIIRGNKLTFLEGCAGVSKTFLLCVRAVELYLKGSINKIVLIRPAVEAGKSLGYLPGTQEEKMYPYLLPIYDNLAKIVDPYVLEEMLYGEDPAVEVLSPTLARGRTLDGCFMIVDEAQNLSSEHLRMILTRIGENTHCGVSMDGAQIDIGKDKSSYNDMELFRDHPQVGHFQFTKEDIVRSELAKMVMEIYEAGNRVE